MEKNTALVFSVGNMFFGIDSSKVTEVVFHHYVSKKEDTRPPYFAMAKVRSMNVPVVCAGQRLGLAERESVCAGNVVVVNLEVNGKMKVAGVMVRAVEGTVRYTSDELEDVTDLLGEGGFGEMVTGALLVDEMPIYLLDLDKFFGHDVAQEVAYESAFCVA